METKNIAQKIQRFDKIVGTKKVDAKKTPHLSYFDEEGVSTAVSSSDDETVAPSDVDWQDNIPEQKLTDCEISSSKLTLNEEKSIHDSNYGVQNVKIVNAEKLEFDAHDFSIPDTQSRNSTCSASRCFEIGGVGAYNPPDLDIRTWTKPRLVLDAPEVFYGLLRRNGKDLPVIETMPSTETFVAYRDKWRVVTSSHQTNCTPMHAHTPLSNGNAYPLPITYSFQPENVSDRNHLVSVDSKKEDTIWGRISHFFGYDQ